MGRLFWKFFIFIWLVQMVGMIGVGFSFWLRDKARAEQMLARPPGQQGETLAPLPPMPPPDGGHATEMRAHPPRPPHLRPPPILVIANLLVGLLSAALLAWYFSKPIRSLRSAFDAAAEGRLDTRLEPTMGKRRDELADLSRDFDHMAGRLQTLMDSQRHLLHDVSHELRSPLARLQAAIGLARQSPEKIETSMDRIELESVRIDNLVGELLTLSRLQAGVMGTLHEDVGMAELMADIIDDARFEAGIQQRAVDFRGSCDVVVAGRAELLGRAIENVVRNAIKHTPPGSAVEIFADHDRTRNLLQLAITDQGNGVPETELQRIFEPFFRSGAENGTDGHGLGLAIAQRVIQAHGGTIVASNQAGGGLRVVMTFPVKTAA